MIREQLIPPPENVGMRKRVPAGLQDVLRDLWLQHFGARKSFDDGTFSGVDYAQYYLKFAQVTLALEHLTRTGIIGFNGALFESSGRIKTELPADIAQDLIFKRKLLNGVDVLVVGGPEGRIFAEMGATVIEFDTFVRQAPKVDLPNLKELEKYFGLWDVPAYQGRFHLTFSSRLFDWGSGLVSRYDEDKGRADEVYSNTLEALLEVTRLGGIGILDGNAMPGAIERNTKLCNLVESATPFKDDRLSESNQIYVLKRI